MAYAIHFEYNFSMNNNYTIDEWNKLSNKRVKKTLFCCFRIFNSK